MRLDKKLTKEEWTTWFNESLSPEFAKVGYDPQYVFNEDESGMFIGFNKAALKCMSQGQETYFKSKKSKGFV